VLGSRFRRKRAGFRHHDPSVALPHVTSTSLSTPAKGVPKASKLSMTRHYSAPLDTVSMPLSLCHARLGAARRYRAECRLCAFQAGCRGFESLLPLPFYAQESSDPGMSPGIHCGFLHVSCGRSPVRWFKATPWLSDTRRVRPSGDVIRNSVLRQALDHLSYSRALTIPSIA